MTFQTRVALVTGAASGLGQAVAQRCATLAQHVVLWDLNEAGMEETAQACTGGSTVHRARVDLANPDQVEAAFQQLQRDGLTPTFIFHAAGILHVGDLFSMDLSHARRLMEVNYLGTVHLLFHAARVLAAGARILCVSSVAGLKGLPEFPAYCGSKHAVVGFCEAVHHDLKRKDIHLSVVCPPAVDTPMVQNLPYKPALYDIFPFAAKAQVVDAILDAATRRDEFIILADFQTRLLRRVNGVLPGVTSRVIGMLVDRWQAKRAG